MQTQKQLLFENTSRPQKDVQSESVQNACQEIGEAQGSLIEHVKLLFLQWGWAGLLFEILKRVWKSVFLSAGLLSFPLPPLLPQHSGTTVTGSFQKHARSASQQTNILADGNPNTLGWYMCNHAPAVQACVSPALEGESHEHYRTALIGQSLTIPSCN